MSRVGGASLALILLWGGASHAKVLPFREVGQPGTHLCWAAAAECAWSTYNVSRPTCELVTSALGRNCCLTGGATNSASCDEPTPWSHLDYLPGVLQGTPVRAVGGSVNPSMGFVEEEIGRDRPVVAWWNLGDCNDFGHVVTAVGIDLDEPPQVLVMDPLPGNAVQTDWSYFQCGPFGKGQCVFYHHIGGRGEKVAGKKTEPNACAEFDDLAVVPAIVGSEVANRVARLLRPEMAARLGLASEGAIECEGEPIAAQYGDSGFPYWMVRCHRNETKFLAAVRPSPSPEMNVIWFGARALRAYVEAARGKLEERPGVLVLRFYPRDGAALLFRSSQPSEGTWLKMTSPD